MTADPQRMEAAFTWVAKFYGPEVGLPEAEKPQNFWTEHILSLANLCKTKVAKRNTAETALQAYEQTKKILQVLDHHNQRMNRWQELDPLAAATGDTLAIYKFIVLLLHNLCIFVDDYITESQEFLTKMQIEKPFADLLSDVNNTGEHWWQGASNPMSSPAVSSPCDKENSFGKYSVMDIPTTPRQPFTRRAVNTPLSPIQKAMHSPVTIKVRQDEYKRMRSKLMEMEHVADLEREELSSQKKKIAQLKEIALEWREKYDAADTLRKQLILEGEQQEEKIEKMQRNTEKMISELRDYKTRLEREVAESQQLRREKQNILEDRDHYSESKAEIEKKLRDVMDEYQVLKENNTSLDNHVTALKKQIERLSQEMGQKDQEIECIRGEHRRSLNQKDEECQEALARQTQLCHDLQVFRLQIEELTEQTEELKKAKEQLHNSLGDKDMELNELRAINNRQLAEAREVSSRQMEILEDKVRKMQIHIDQANKDQVEKENIIQELREKLLADLGEIERFASEKAKMQSELKEAQKELYGCKTLNVKLQNQVNESQLLVAELEDKLNHKSEEVRRSFERMEALEAQLVPLLENLKKPAPVAVIKEEAKEIPVVIVQQEVKEAPVDVSMKTETDDELPQDLHGQNDGDMSHLDWDGEEKRGYLMYSKSILGTDSTSFVHAKEERFKAEDTDKDRVIELQRRNRAVPPALRSSYATEVASYNSPSGEEISIKGDEGRFLIPRTPSGSIASKKSKRMSFSGLFGKK